MQRGSTTLYKNIFGDEIPAMKVVGEEPTLRQQKINCMIDWYYYMGRKTKFNYEYLVQIMEPVFFLASRTIHDILQDNREQLLDVKKEWKAETEMAVIKKRFAKKWPALNWDWEA